jgi:hypothetical protein
VAHNSIIWIKALPGFYYQIHGYSTNCNGKIRSSWIRNKQFLTDCNHNQKLWTFNINDIFCMQFSYSFYPLTWHKHICAKRKQLGITLTKIHWLHGRKSKFPTSNKLLIYKTILKQIWTYGIQLWGTASTSNIEILERFQSKALRMISGMHLGMCRIRLSERISKYQRLKKKSAAIALNIVLASANTQITY